MHSESHFNGECPAGEIAASAWLRRSAPATGSPPERATTDSPADDVNAQIVRSTSDGLWIFDHAGTTTFANDRLAAMLGYPSEDMVGLQVEAVLDAPGRIQFAAHMRDLAATDGTGGPGEENLECYFLRSDGTYLWALASYSPLLDAAGSRRGWLHRVTEITARKLLLDQVAFSEQQLAEAQAIAKVGSWEWDMSTDVVVWSDELYRSYNLVPQEFEATYEGFLSYIHPEDRKRVEGVIETAFAGVDEFTFDSRIIKQGGEEGWIRGLGRVTRDTDGTPVKVAGVSHDITPAVLAAQELAEAREAAEHASRMKSEFLATMSHEIRTPLSGVLGLTDLLLGTELSASQLRLAAGVAQAGRTLLGLVNDILDISKIEAGKLELEAVDFDLGAVLDQVTTLMAEPARTQNVTLVLDAGNGMPAMVRGDPGRLGQVITNLVSNAIKFTKDGTVTLTAAPDDSSAAPYRGARPAHHVLRFEVSDTGIGVPVAAQRTLFDSFTQADASTSRAYGGTGLGLTISRRLVEAMGGEIGFTSEAGVGSTFWFTATFGQANASSTVAPTEPGDGTDVRPEAAPSPGCGFGPSRGTVLVAEDNLINQMVAGGVVEALGYDVEFAADGAQAVACVTSNPDAYVAVLMDCHMPTMDGYDATQAIREHERGTGVRIPVIAMTASAVLGERERCMASGMDDFLVKPADFLAVEHALACWTATTGPAATTTHPPARRAHPRGDRVLDEERMNMLADLRPGEHSFLTQFLETFLDRTAADVAAITHAIKTHDPAALVRAAHVLKGSASNLGVARVGRVCQELEDAGQRNDLVDAHGLVAELVREVADARLALRDTITTGQLVHSVGNFYGTDPGARRGGRAS